MMNTMDNQRQTVNCPSVVAIFGATSTIGGYVAVKLAESGFDLLLVGRNPEETERNASDIRIRYGVQVDTYYVDADDIDFERKIDFVKTHYRLRGLIWCWGILGNEPERSTLDEIGKNLTVNFTSAVVAIEMLLPAIELNGFLVILSSVAGDRGRGRNYLYGASKAGLTVFGQGLQHRVGGKGPIVIVVKLGIVRTKMTEGMNTALMASPEWNSLYIDLILES
ncbi:hypothetical protein BFX06_09855 [Sulfobacillus thermosulfidooxidans]|nr:hypothetical protein BFX06_09855 [Sulfobacillus thermosulfidooxidans]